MLSVTTTSPLSNDRGRDHPKVRENGHQSCLVRLTISTFQ